MLGANLENCICITVAAFVLLFFLSFSLHCPFPSHRLQIDFPSPLGPIAHPPRLNVTAPTQAESSDCPKNAIANDVVVIVKTGATEAAERIPVIAKTSLRCVKHVLYFSDLEQDIEGIHLHDALDSVKAAVKKDNPDFTFYEKQSNMWETKHNITSLQGAKLTTNQYVLAAWSLDKYKNVHITEKTWNMAPNKKWYVFIDADTYLIWSSLLLWLEKLDPTRKMYAGSVTMSGRQPFAHGGSGYILSRKTIESYNVDHKGSARRWERRIPKLCCGDLAVGMALQAQGNRLEHVWPSTSQETQDSMPFTAPYWCRPQFTLHHMSTDQMHRMSHFELQRANQNRAVTPAELYHNVFPEIPMRRDNWDNLAWDKGELGHSGGLKRKSNTFNKCALECAEKKSCLQFLHHGHDCYLGLTIRHGQERKPEKGVQWNSGWYVPRIQAIIRNQSTCNYPQFPRQGYIFAKTP